MTGQVPGDHAASEGEVLVERHGAVTLLTINRPQAYNALNATVIAALRDVVTAAADDARCRAVILTGSGQKAFCAGADLREIAGLTIDEAEAYMRAGQAAFRDIAQAGVPVIAAVNGLALGGGFELVLASTFAVVATEASFGLPESGLGLLPGYGGTQRLPRIIGAQAATHLMLTGTRLSADRAYQLGLALLPPVATDGLVAAALEVAQIVARQGPNAVRATLRAVRQGQDVPLEAGLSLETGLAALAVAGSESSEGVAAFLERRTPSYREVSL